VEFGQALIAAQKVFATRDPEALSHQCSCGLPLGHYSLAEVAASTR